MTHRKRLIEVSLPLAAISKQSAREKSIRHGHISTLHIWWARRPLAAMRAAIFAALIPAPESDAERERLEKLIETIVDWDQVKNGNSEAIEEARRLIREAFPDGPPKLLDPFMGGGATGLEALRLGCETHAVELNPVAHLIELCTLVYPQKYGRGAGEPFDKAQDRQGRKGAKAEQMELPGQERPQQLVMEMAAEYETSAITLADDVRRWGEWVLEQARAEIGHLYQNPLPLEGGGPGRGSNPTIVGYIWARTVTCPNPACRAEMPLVRQWWLAKKKNRKIALKPVVDQANKQISFEVVDLKGKTRLPDFDPSNGTSSRSAGTCLMCRQVADKEYVKAEGVAGRMGQRLLAVIYDQAAAGKGYRPATETDEALFEQAQTMLQELDPDGELIPTELIPSGSSRAIFVYLYGLTRWGDLFNARQSLALLTFSRQVRAAYEAMLAEGMESERAKAVVTYLGMGLNKLAMTNSNMARWFNHLEAICPAFAGQRLAMIWDYLEINPFTTIARNWSSEIEWIAKVIEHVSSIENSPIDAIQGTSTRLLFQDDSLDAVVTDPPYYDAVPYADLSDFFYVWLKRSVGFLHPELFRTPLTPKSNEIIQEPARHENDDMAKAFYEQEMTRAFSEARRVLKPDGVFVVVFAHKSITAWETLLNSLLEAGLVVTASWPLHTELTGRLRARESAALASSIFIICRVRTTDSEGYFDDVRAELTKVIKERLDFFWAQGIRGSDFFISAIGPAVSVFGRYRQVYRLDGSQVGVKELLDLIQVSVAEYALDRILNSSAALSAGGSSARLGGVDAATRYYILHRWAYGQEKVPFDDAMRLAMALGADVSTLMERRGLLKQSGETVSLLGPKERGRAEALGLPDRSGRLAGVIDVLHRAAVLWESGDRDQLARFLADGAQGRGEQIRLVAQTIINILPDDDPERRLLEGFLQGRDTLPDVPRQGRLM